MVGVDNVRPDDALNVISARKAASLRASQQLAFRRWTVSGYIHCRAEVPIGLCDRCASIHWTQEAEALIEEAVRRE
jgi:hypothetical protein